MCIATNKCVLLGIINPICGHVIDCNCIHTSTEMGSNLTNLAPSIDHFVAFANHAWLSSFPNNRETARQNTVRPFPPFSFLLGKTIEDSGESLQIGEWKKGRSAKGGSICRSHFREIRKDNGLLKASFRRAVC